jgi:hypothetical protein
MKRFPDSLFNGQMYYWNGGKILKINDSNEGIISQEIAKMRAFTRRVSVRGIGIATSQFPWIGARKK